MVRGPRIAIVAVLLALTVMGVSGCTSSGARGTVSIYGMAADPRVKQPLPGANVVVHEGRSDVSRIVASVNTDSKGAFRVDLAPGTYTLTLGAASGTPQVVTVRPGEYATATLVVQNKL